MTSDKGIYVKGDWVAITLTNTGDGSLEFPDSALDLQIKNVDTTAIFRSRLSA
jgi:hypothetical protein